MCLPGCRGDRPAFLWPVVFIVELVVRRFFTGRAALSRTKSSPFAFSITVLSSLLMQHDCHGYVLVSGDTSTEAGILQRHSNRVVAFKARTSKGKEKDVSGHGRYGGLLLSMMQIRRHHRRRRGSEVGYRVTQAESWTTNIVKMRWVSVRLCPDHRRRVGERATQTGSCTTSVVMMRSVWFRSPKSKPSTVYWAQGLTPLYAAAPSWPARPILSASGQVVSPAPLIMPGGGNAVVIRSSRKRPRAGSAATKRRETIQP